MLPPRPMLAALLLATAVPSIRALQTAPFTDLTNTRSEFTNFNVETVRGLCRVPGGNGLYALNTHGSMLVWHQDLTPAPEGNWPTVNNPVALAHWNNTILVVGGGTHALVQHDRFDGRILNGVRLPSEPADIVVDLHPSSPTFNSAYVACQGANAVVRVDLSSFTVANTYPIASQRPRFLFLEHVANQPHVYVTPFLSGNNTIPVPPKHPQLNANGERGIIVSLAGQSERLPDEDLYRIVVTSASGSAQVTPVLRGAGTLLTRHGRNPLDGKYWILSVDALNAQPGSSEPSIRGAFAKSQLAIAATLAPGAQPATLDLELAGGGYSPSSALSFPFALAFRASGYAVVASSTGDRLALLDPAGARVRDVWLPAGSIPRDLLFDSTGNILFVYAWGTNRVLVYDFNALPLPPSTSVPFTLELGHDPTPAPIRAGRTLWYDADRSLNARTTCNTCHPGGKFDGLAWAISDDPSDRKDIMVTQSLLSIHDTPNYHWRGERDLRQFNVAFVRLLGGSSVLSTAEFDQLESFLFSLQAPANPRENDARVVDDAREVITLPDGYASQATQGQSEFRTVPALFGNTCVSCHQGQTGSDGSLTMDTVGLFIPSAMTLDVAHLRELFHKDQPAYTLNIGSPPLRVARNGFGLLHDGAEASVFDFVEPIAAGGPFTIDEHQQANLVSFVRQFDAGLAPAGHLSQLIDAAHSGAAQLATVNGLFLPQAGNGWIDLVVISRLGGQDVRWLYRAAAVPPAFVSSATGIGPLTPAALLSQAQQGQNSALFLGLPPGNGRRFALDPDLDHLEDPQELAWGTNRFVPDTDGDTYEDGYEVANAGHPTVQTVVPADAKVPYVVSASLDHAGAAYAKYFVEFSEPVVYEVTASANGVAGAPVHTMRSVVPQRLATIVVQGLESSTQFSAPNQFTPALTFADRAGLSGSASLPTAMTDTHALSFNGLTFFPEMIVDSMRFPLPLARTGNSLSGQLEVRVRNKARAPAASPIAPTGFVVLQVLVEKPPISSPKEKKDWQVSDTGPFSLTSPQKTSSVSLRALGQQLVPYTAITGALLVRQVDANGLAQFSFTQSGLTSGQGLRFNLVGIFDAWQGAPNPPPPQPPLEPFHPLSVMNYQLAATAPDKRALDATF